MPAAPSNQGTPCSLAHAFYCTASTSLSEQSCWPSCLAGTRLSRGSWSRLDPSPVRSCSFAGCLEHHLCPSAGIVPFFFPFRYFCQPLTWTSTRRLPVYLSPRRRKPVPFLSPQASRQTLHSRLSPVSLLAFLLASVLSRLPYHILTMTLALQTAAPSSRHGIPPATASGQAG
ncbi:hypothetical protein GQ53DRAFT_154271 [Thozetella sp. PMI_491]|nr:hypothetical protein GQ53DRAFT_154271 [Thozetella sp. PMI_491]